MEDLRAMFSFSTHLLETPGTCTIKGPMAGCQEDGKLSCKVLEDVCDADSIDGFQIKMLAEETRCRDSVVQEKPAPA
jgi:hypothetical protein